MGNWTEPILWRWIHPEKRRWYLVWVGLDLFGDRVLIRAWGSLDSRRGGEKREIPASEAEIDKRLHAIARQRRRRGYVVCGGSP
nr:hypothetical conserved protein [uncultured Gammaproteobacteria bacterium]